MNKREINDCNRLIARFMTNHTGRNLKGVYIYKGEKRVFVKYDSSWDWLMAVVEKIEKGSYKDDRRTFEVGASFTIEDDTCKVSIGGMSDFEFPHKGPPMTKIEAVWEACTKFIKWYNEQ